MIHIQIISGTDRPGANALRVSQYLLRQYRKQGVVVGLTNLQESPTAKVAGGLYGKDIPEISSFIPISHLQAGTKCNFGR